MSHGYSRTPYKQYFEGSLNSAVTSPSAVENSKIDVLNAAITSLSETENSKINVLNTAITSPSAAENSKINILSWMLNSLKFVHARTSSL
jgi:hypothetical protein